MWDRAWRFCTLVPAVALFVLTRAAQADLTWQAPAQCPPAVQVSSEIDRLLAGSAYPEDALDAFSLAVTHDARTKLFVVRITRREGGTHQERVVEAADCGELVQAAALAVALAIDPELEAAPPSPAPAPAAAPPETPETASAESAVTTAPVTPAAPVSPTPPSLPAQTRPPPVATVAPIIVADTAPPKPTPPASEVPSLVNPRLSGFALVSGDSGSMPEAALGLGGGVAVAGEATRVQLALESFSSTETEPDPSGAYARFTLYRAHVSVCYSPFAERIFLFGCATLQAGRLRARGRGVADVHQVNRAWFAAGADLLVLGSLADRTWLQLRGGVARPLIERDYVMNGSSVHQVQSWVFDAALGVEFRFN